MSRRAASNQDSPPGRGKGVGDQKNVRKRRHNDIIMKTIKIFFLSFLLTSYCDIGFAAKILFKDGKELSFDKIVDIANEAVVITTPKSILGFKLSTIAMILFDETFEPEKSGIYLNNDDHITGKPVAFRNGHLTVEMDYGTYIIEHIESIQCINLTEIDKKDFQEPAQGLNWESCQYFFDTKDEMSEFEESQNKASAIFYITSLGEMECIGGEMLLLEKDRVSFKRNNHISELKIDNIHQIQFAGGCCLELSGSDFPVIHMRNGDNIYGIIIQFKDQKLSVKTEVGSVEITDIQIITGIVF